MKLHYIAVMAIFILTFSGCAKIADPEPPLVQIPRAASDLTARQSADSIILQASLPRQNTDGSPVTHLQRVDVYRLMEELPAAKEKTRISPEQFQDSADPIVSIDHKRLSEFSLNHVLTVEDTFSDLEPSERYKHSFRYALLFVNDKNQAAGFSNQVVIAPLAIPPPPSDIRAEVLEGSIRIYWTEPLKNMDGSKPPRIVGYNVYRSMEHGVDASRPINQSPLQKPEFKDVHFDFDNTYYYRVSVVGSIRNPMIESALSEKLSVTPMDRFKPLPVRDFNAVPDKDSVLLLWQPSPSADVAGYRIFRTESSQEEGSPIGEELIDAYSYRDSTVISGRAYTYTITTVDTHGNESRGIKTNITLP
ncbi:MAG: fibronectin type III domain-containing protein [Acidobacteriota bacterium]